MQIRIQTCLSPTQPSVLPRVAESLANAIRVARQNDVSLSFTRWSIAYLAQAPQLSVATKDELIAACGSALSVDFCFFGTSVEPAEAHRRMADQTKAEFVLLLPPDSLVEPRFFVKMASFFATHPDAGLVQARTAPLAQTGSYDPATLEINDCSETDTLMLSAAALHACDGFDTALCNRLRKLGMKNRHLPDCVVFMPQRCNAIQAEEMPKAPMAPAVDELFARIRATVHEDSVLHRTVAAYLDTRKNAPRVQKFPFLSIVTRTQGTRPEKLAELLLCLCGQSCDDFELLLMLHRADADAWLATKRLVDELPARVRARTRMIRVENGGRTTPLNVGFAEARGRYIAALDDDDLIFSHWVEAFYNLSLIAPDRILHTYAVGQDWKEQGNAYAPQAAPLLDTAFCTDFALLPQMRLNYCPFCTLAFPAYIYHEWGIHFDESLSTTEDWDYLMRSAALAGVADARTVTFLYRRWKDGDNSIDRHAYTEWRENHRRVMTRIEQGPLLVTGNDLQDVLQPSPFDPPKASEAEFYCDTGNGFTADGMWARDRSYDDPQFGLCYRPKEGSALVHALRFDPRHFAALTLTELAIRLLTADRKAIDIPLGQIETNGLRIDERIVFLQNDPQIILHLKQPVTLSAVLLHYREQPYVSDADTDVYLRTVGCKNAGSENRLLGAIKRIFKR